MPKKRIHELAKEIHKQSSDIVSYIEKISSKKVSHMNTIDEDMVQKVISHFSESKSGEATKHMEKKKSSTSVVFKPENSRTGNRPGRPNRSNDRTHRHSNQNNQGHKRNDQRNSEGKQYENKEKNNRSFQNNKNLSLIHI